MKENSIEKDIDILNNVKEYMQESINKGYHKFCYNELCWDEKCVDIINAIDSIIEAYKEVLKENEELNKKVKVIIDRIDCDIKKTKEIIAKNRDEHTKNDYQIVRLRAMNTKSLDIKKRLQELLESEK